MAKLGVFYPPSANNVNHSVEIQKILNDKAEETKEWILKVKAQSKDFKSILLSDECAALFTNDPRFHDFLTFLDQNFSVKYIYCVRKIVPSVGSHLTMDIINAVLTNNSNTLNIDELIKNYIIQINYMTQINALPTNNSDTFNIDELIKNYIIQRIDSYDFYSRLNTTFLSYEDLAKSGKLVQTFFDQAMGLKKEISDRSFNTMGHYDGRAMGFTDKQLAHLERIFSVTKGSLVAAYHKPDSSLELSKALSSLIKERTEKILNAPIYHMGKSNPYPSIGFSDFERSHRWTEGTKASITLPLKDMERRPARVSFLNTRGLVTDSHSQDLTVKVNGKEVGRYVYTSSNNNQTIDIPLPKADQAKIEFEIPHAASPFDLGIGDDKRTLGILFDEVHFQF
ncbi:MAG: hypothetical protein MRY83_07650 [Flavobacteriales bacterium]|nr:hypothetical protein [Flavobacteriales bacterium]